MSKMMLSHQTLPVQSQIETLEKDVKYVQRDIAKCLKTLWTLVFCQ